MKHLLLLAFMAMSSIVCVAQQERALPSPQFPADADRPLSQVLKSRRSIRAYADKPIDDATLSCLLWAACGVSEPATGKITAPSAVNRQDVRVYVCTAQGAYLYNAKQHSLSLVTNKDLRKALAANQHFAATAPMNLLLVSDTNKFPRRSMEYGCMDTGYVSQNIYLACTSMGLGTVARAQMDIDILKKELLLKEGEVPILNHPVGYPK